MTALEPFFEPFFAIYPIVWEILVLLFPQLRGHLASNKGIKSLNNMSPRLFRIIAAAIFLAITYLVFYLQHYVTTFALFACFYSITFVPLIERLIIRLNNDEEATRRLEMSKSKPLPPTVRNILIIALIIAVLYLFWIW